MKARLIDDLKSRFPILTLDDLGEVVVVPSAKLDLKWISYFLKEGFRFEGTRFDGYPVVLVCVRPFLTKKVGAK